MTAAKKILFLKRSFKQRGGLEKQAQLIINSFQERGYEVNLFLEETDDPKKFSTTFSKKTIGPSFYKIHHYNEEVKRFLSKNSFDCIFGFDRTEQQTIIRLGNGIHKSFLERKKLISPWYKNIFPKNPQDLVTLRIEKDSFSHPQLNKIIANSHMVKRELLATYPVDPNKIHVIHNGVEWTKNELAFQEQFHLDPKKIPFDINKNKIHIVFIGHGFQRKGLFFLLKALKNLYSHDFLLHVIGEDKNLKKFENLVIDWNLQHAVKFHGNVNQTQVFFQIADLCVIPSIYDPFANVTVEALSYGIPVISSKYNGGSEVVSSLGGSIIEDLEDDQSFSLLIKNHMKKKEASIATKIREEVKCLDISLQLDKLIQACLS